MKKECIEAFKQEFPDITKQLIKKFKSVEPYSKSNKPWHKEKMPIILYANHIERLRFKETFKEEGLSSK